MSPLGLGLFWILLGCTMGILDARFKQYEDFDSFISGWLFIAMGLGSWALAYALDALPKPEEYANALRHDFDLGITLLSFPCALIGLYLILAPARFFENLKRQHFRVPSEPSRHYLKMVFIGVAMLVLSLSRFAWVVLTSSKSGGAP